MKKLFYILASSAVLLLASCDKIVTVTLEDGVDARVTASMKEWQKELTSAPYGWIFDIQTIEGYYQFHMKFTEDNKVEMYSDNTYYYTEFYATPKTSTWSMKSLQRPVLAFDTYSYLAVINDPDNAVSGGSGNMGLGTDFEFEVDDYTDGVFHFTGRVNRIDAFARKATEAEYEKVQLGGLMDAVVEPTYYNEGEFNYFLDGARQIAVSFNGRSVDFNYVDENNNVVNASSNVVVDLDYNMTLLEPFKVDGLEISKISFKESESKFYAEAGDKSFEVVSQATPIIPLHFMLGAGLTYTYIEGIPSMYPSVVQTVNEAGYYFNQAINKMKSGSYRSYAISDYTLKFTKTESGADRLVFEGYFGGFSGWATYYITFNETRDQFTVDKMTFEDDMYGNMSGVFYGAGANIFVDYFVGKTFKIEWSNVKFGSYAMGQLTAVGTANPSYVIGALFAE